jgi:transposase
VDPFHVIQLATVALDEVRRKVWNEARRAGQTAVAKELKGARFALWKNPESLTARQQAKLSDLQATNKRLYRAYLLRSSCARSSGFRPRPRSGCSSCGCPGRAGGG